MATSPWDISELKSPVYYRGPLTRRGGNDLFTRQFLLIAGDAVSKAAKKMAVVPAGSKKAIARLQANKVGPALLTYINTEQLGIQRNNLGQFTKFQNASRPFFQATAEEMQKRVVDYTYGSLRRPGVSTGRLRKVLEDPRMISVDPKGFGFQVGNERFLANSDAKYWEIKEFGSAQTVKNWTGAMVGKHGEYAGLPLFGLWGGSASLSGGNVRVGGPWTRYGRGSGGKLRPDSPAVIKEMFKTGVDSRGRSMANRRPKAPYRKRQVVPTNAFAQAWASMDNGNQITRRIEDMAIEFLLPKKSGGG